MNSLDAPNDKMTLRAPEEMKHLDQQIRGCNRCPRLRAHCLKIAAEKRKSFSSEIYDGKPTPNFGDAHARLLIVGLAPAAHGANRTGRMFTGDRSGQWLYRALHRAGFANQPTWETANDGLILKDCLITAAAHCAPPDNKPNPVELAHCQPYFARTLELTRPKVILALGSIAWTTFIKQITPKPAPKLKFGHGAEFLLENDSVLLGSYHPSQQNTFTGRLTEEMFDTVFARARELLNQK